MPVTESPLEIALAPSPLWPALAQLLFSDLPSPEREAAIQGLLHPSPHRTPYLALAQRQGQLVGVAAAVTLPGAAAMLTPARRTSDEPRETATALHALLVHTLAERGTSVVQALLLEEATEAAQSLAAGQFVEAGELLVMLCELPKSTNSFVPPDLSFSPILPDDQQRLIRLLENTYIGSRDVPILNDRRRLTDVIAGYRLTGEIPAEGWQWVQQDGEDVGCVLITRHAPTTLGELLYMGLVPAARGRGWGLSLAAHAQRQAKLCGCEQLVLGVDAANAPAVEVYRRLGFQPLQQRRLWLRFIDP